MNEEVCAIGDRKRFRAQFYDQDKSVRKMPLDCSRCAMKDHKAGDEKCPAIGKKCGRCGKMDHFARKCFTKVNMEKSSPVKPETVNMVETYNDYDDTF